MLGGDAFRAVWASEVGHSIVSIPGSEAAILSTRLCLFPFAWSDSPFSAWGPIFPDSSMEWRLPGVWIRLSCFIFLHLQLSYRLASLFPGPGSGWHCLLRSFSSLDNGHVCPGSFLTQFCFLQGRQLALLMSDLYVPCGMTYHGSSGLGSISCAHLYARDYWKHSAMSSIIPLLCLLCVDSST